MFRKDNESLFRNNTFVYTRTNREDYKYHVETEVTKPFWYEVEECIREYGWSSHDQERDRWREKEFSKVKILFRGIEDGKTDECGRSILRVEGIILPKKYNIDIHKFEEYLSFLQLQTNNYSYEYGFDYSKGTKKNEQSNYYIAPNGGTKKNEQSNYYIAPNGTLWASQEDYLEYENEQTNAINVKK